MTRKIAIDGPSGSGKSTVAKLVAKRLGLLYLDTGAIYRAITLALMDKGVDLEDEQAVEKSFKDINLKFIDQKPFLDQEDVSARIREDDVTANVSLVSAYPFIRSGLLDMQRNFALDNDVILDGRDIATVVLPDADLKIFLTASPEVRAGRRLNDEKSKSTMTYEEVLADIKRRDEFDSNRKIAPLKKADDALELDSSDMTIDQVVDFISDSWSKL